jgi:hypothetical protein
MKMDKKAFTELLKNTKEASQIISGDHQPSKVFKHEDGNSLDSKKRLDKALSSTDSEISK